MSLKIALPKGRLADEVLKLLKYGGVCAPDFKHTRKLALPDENGENVFFLAKPADVPAYVEHGAADIGVAGYDTIAEENRDLSELLDLGLGGCVMAVAGCSAAISKLNGSGHIRVATKYPHTAEKYFFNSGRHNAEIIKLNGSVELAAAVGLADVIVDIVQTGDTIKQNGLEVIKAVFPVSARLIANPASLALKNGEIAAITYKLKKAIRER